MKMKHLVLFLIFLFIGKKLRSEEITLENITIPTYRAIVRKTVKTQLNLNEEAGLVFFTQNSGRENLKKLVSGENRLNDGNKDSVVTVMPLYYQSNNRLRTRYEFQLKVYPGKPFESKT